MCRRFPVVFGMQSHDFITRRRFLPRDLRSWASAALNLAAGGAVCDVHAGWEESGGSSTLERQNRSEGLGGSTWFVTGSSRGDCCHVSSMLERGMCETQSHKQ